MMMMFLLHSCPRGGSAKKSFIALPLPRHSFFFSRKSRKVIRGDHFSEVAFKGGIGQISPCLALNPSNPPPGDKK